ncbi:uncharacterized protein BCR38DRAFT_486116 [Pseudomassariella vexata]|uniref:Helicase C-terminal domain-containing protein n=1 Tax=Pseudomassariella vexata TaxID=1141098 RepID=A0A1Y2DVS1_9PEZI|nr:uncharacterized protein BCR38DRAFT_486116 [Pseudomassariella vexata]ORY63371.1 hypothetical protein BCR38DRAFT_486116 [Pseudomassariella vexata]
MKETTVCLDSLFIRVNGVPCASLASCRTKTGLKAGIRTVADFDVDLIRRKVYEALKVEPSMVPSLRLQGPSGEKFCSGLELEMFLAQVKGGYIPVAMEHGLLYLDLVLVDEVVALSEIPAPINHQPELGASTVEGSSNAGDVIDEVVARSQIPGSTSQPRALGKLCDHNTPRNSVPTANPSPGENEMGVEIDSGMKEAEIAEEANTSNAKPVDKERIAKGDGVEVNAVDGTHPASTRHSAGSLVRYEEDLYNRENNIRGGAVDAHSRYGQAIASRPIPVVLRDRGQTAATSLFARKRKHEHDPSSSGDNSTAKRSKSVGVSEEVVDLTLDDDSDDADSNANFDVTADDVRDEDDDQARFASRVSPANGGNSYPHDQVCEWMDCPPGTTEFMIPGIKVPLKDHQVANMHYTFTRPDNFIAGEVNSDDMGLGKTVESYGKIVFRAICRRPMAEAREQWEQEGKESDPSSPRKHLPSDQTADMTCPRTRPGFRCPCEKHGLSYRIANNHPDFPSVIIASPSNNSPVKMRWTVMHDKYKKSPYYHDTAAVERTKCDIDVQNRAIEKSSLCENIIIVSSSMTAKRFLEQYEVEFDDETTIAAFAAAFVVMDEVSDYCKSDTSPFKLLEAVRQRSPKLTMVLGLGAGQLQAGPRSWTNFVRHFNASAKALKWQQHKDLQPENWAKVCTDWSYCCDKYQLRSSSRSSRYGEVYRRRFKGLKKVAGPIVCRMIMQRKAIDVLNGHVIIPLLPFQTNVVDLPMTDPRCYRVAQVLISNVLAYVDIVYQEALQRWENWGRKGVKPTKHNTATKVITSSKAYGQLVHSATYPGLAVLVDSEKLRQDDLLASTLNPAMKEVTLMITNKGHTRGEVQQLLKQTLFWRHLHYLRTTSPKYAELREIIKMMTHRQDDPADTENRHMLVFTRNPISTFITFMLLHEDHPGVDIGMIHSGVDIGCESQSNPHCRGAIFSWLNTTGAKPKILVGCHSMFAKGPNLQRANYCVQLEVAEKVGDEVQAMGRVARQGHERIPVVYTFFDSRNCAEMTTRNKHENASAAISTLLEWKRETSLGISRSYAGQSYAGTSLCP